MKLKKTKTIKYSQILKLQLVKSRIYELNVSKKNYLNDENLNNTIINIKKALKIIFKYNRLNKRILFLGIDNDLLIKKINTQTNHVALSKKFKTQGLISGKHNLKQRYLLPKLKTKPNLIIIFNSVENVNSVLKESHLLKIPTIIFGTIVDEIKNADIRSFFNIKGNFTFISNQNFFYKYLNFLFKKQYYIKQKQK